jgi:multiple sugar transport system ATP-binding protein
MNFLEGRIARHEDRLWFEEGSGRLPVPPAQSAPLAAHVGQNVTLGVRPESISDRDHARFACEDNQLEVRVTLVQPLGHKMDVFLATERHPHIVAQLDAFGGLAAGQALRMFFDMERAHFFEPGENGKRITASARDMASVSS